MRLIKVNWCSAKVNIPGLSYNKYQTETAFQIYCADWLRKKAELTADDAFKWWHHSANERGNGAEGFKAKMMGQAKGMPDFIHYGLRLAIELKIPGGKVSKEQMNWLLYFKRIGWTSEIVFDFESFREIVCRCAGIRGVR